MKIRFFLLCFLMYGWAFGQEEVQIKSEIVEKMKHLKQWEGQWEGTGWFREQDGNVHTFTQTEDIRLTLDSTLLLIEGIGMATDEPDIKIHHAFATISYEVNTKTYRMRSYTMEGQYTNALFEVLGEGQYKWSFTVPGGSLAFTIMNDGNNWNEKGYFIDPKGIEYSFLEMNLKKL